MLILSSGSYVVAAPRLENEGADKKSHLVRRFVTGVEVTTKLFDQLTTTQHLFPDCVGAEQTSMHVLWMSVHQHDVVPARRQLPQQPEVVAHYVTWLRAVDEGDVT